MPTMDEDPADNGSRSLTEFERVIEASQRFEAAWMAGQRPVIEAFLSETTDRERAMLLPELVELELELRRARGEQPTRQEYQSRFPGHEGLIDEVFAHDGEIGGGETTHPFSPSAQAAAGEGRRFGDYELLEEIARGGMGIVYKARQVSLDRLVALKMILVGRFASREQVRRFHREARAAARLRHPGIVRILDLGLYEDRHCIAMDLVEGPSLAKRVAAGPLDQREAARLVRSIAEAVQFAHDRGIIHRDLKPGNVLIDGQGNPLITDFGVAKSSQADGLLSFTGQAVGTPSYMPPEQARGGDDVGPASDVYALGATLYCLLTGRPPLQSATAVETLRLVIECEPVPPRRLVPGLDRDLEVICLKCLRKEPGQRYPRADALARELGRYLAGEPIEARPAGPVEKVALWSRKNPVLAGLSAAVLVLSVMMIVGSVLYTLGISAALRDVNQKLVRQYVLNGIRCLDDGDRLGALPWFAKALQLDAGDPRRERIHRLRIQSVLAHCPKLVDFQQLGGAFDHAQFSGDGRRVVQWSEAEARVWDPARGMPVTPPLRHSAAIKCAVFSVDGRRVATASADGTARVWDAATGAPLTPPLMHRDEVNDVSFSPDGRFVLTAVGSRQRGPIGEAVLWEVATSRMAVAPLRHDDDVYCARFSSDGRRIVTASYDGTARLWDAATGSPVSRPLVHASPVTLAAYDPTGSHVATVSGEEVRVWDVSTGAPTAPPVRHRGPIAQVVFAPDGTRFATEAHDRRVRVWDAVTGGPRESAIPENSESTISFGAEGRQLNLRTARGDRSIRVWDTAVESPQVILMRHQHAVTCASYSADGRRVLTASFDRSWRIWDAKDGLPLTPPVLQDNLIESAAFSPDDRLVVTGGRDGAARVWSATDGRPLSAPLKHNDWVSHVSFSPDGRSVLTASWDGTARVWDAASGKPLTPPLRHGRPVLHAVFRPDGRRVATAGGDGVAQVWDVATGRPSSRPLKHADWIVNLAFSPDGRRLVTASRDRTARLWDVETSTQATPPLRHERTVRHAVFSPDGRRVATASDDRTARVWDTLTGAPITPPLKHEDRVNRVLFDPDGLFVLSASGGPDTAPAGEVRMWDAATGDALLLPLKHGDDVNTVVLSPDGRHILTASFDGTARIWPLRTEDRPVADLLALAGSLSGARVDETGGLVALGREELMAVWNRLRVQYPESASCSASAVFSWHQREAMTCERRKNWAGAHLHLSRLIETRPDSWDLFFRRARARSELGRWSEAQNDYSRAIRLGSDEPLVWQGLALVLLAQGDLPGYRQARAALLDRFRGTRDPRTKNLLSWTCACVDDPQGPLAEAVQFAREAVADRPRTHSYLSTLGAALYRRSCYEEAIRRLNEAIEARDGEGTGQEFLFLALAQARLGRTEAARASLEKADRWWAQAPGSHPSHVATPHPLLWDERLLFRRLRQEAAANLDSAGSPEPVPS